MPDTATLGHNIPPTDADPLRDRLEQDHAGLIARRDELLAGIERAPKTVEDEETAKKMADFVQKQIDAFLKRADAVHEDEKAPFLAAGRTVDSFWHALIDDIKKGKAVLNAARKVYADRKAAEERRRREEEARRQREEAERLRREAEEAAAKLREEEGLAAAIAAEEAAKAAAAEAERAAKAAAAKPAELGKTRGDHGGQTSLKQFWDFANLNRETIDLEALRDHIPMDALEKAVRSWIRANGEALKRGVRIDGVDIFENTRI